MNNCHPNYEAILGCPNCSGIYFIDNLDYFLDYKYRLWRRLLLRVEDSFSKRHLIGSLAVSNAKKNVIRAMKENGMLLATCLSCMNYVLDKETIDMKKRNSLYTLDQQSFQLAGQ